MYLIAVIRLLVGDIFTRNIFFAWDKNVPTIEAKSDLYATKTFRDPKFLGTYMDQVNVQVDESNI